jgi:hypothetical protein
LGEIRCSWIAHSISLVCFTILVDDIQFNFFSSSRGLRQEDPLSSFLFAIVMETFLTYKIKIKMEAFSKMLIATVDGVFS